MVTESARSDCRFRIVAQDPAVRGRDGKILMATVAVPNETHRPGPWGHRTQVIDYDCSRNIYYPPPEGPLEKLAALDHQAEPDALIADPGFHCRNVYAIVMRTLARFEHALGRHVSWGSKDHQLKIAPHAFADANAFYSRSDEALLFGYFPSDQGKNMVYTCLSHDVVVHETTHALLDGLHDRYLYPSSPDQAAFHEAFADIVALLSVFSLDGVVKSVLAPGSPPGDELHDLIQKDQLTSEAIKKLALLGLAEQMGKELNVLRGEALRRSVTLERSPDYYNSPDYRLPHLRGEILVAAVMNAFVAVWLQRLRHLAPAGGQLYLDRVVEEGRDVADYLLTMAIRALDFMPPLHIQFCDYLSALITADLEIHPDDSRYDFRDHLRTSFKAYGVEPADGAPVSTPEDEPAPARKEPRAKATVVPVESGAWKPVTALPLEYEHTHLEPMMREPDEVFHFIWENRKVLKLQGRLCNEAFCRVLSVKPCLHISRDGFALRETIAEFYQVVRLRARELKKYHINIPADMPPGLLIPLYGGGTLVFNEYGRLKYYVHNALDNRKRQETRIADLWHSGAFGERDGKSADFAQMHRNRVLNFVTDPREEW